MADWLQGPYVYQLYMEYGYSHHDIALLFVAGFGSSMLFGSFVGALADRFGRRRFCQLYCVLYILSCATKHGKDFWLLMVGRVLGGMATSLLFSVFESWLVCEHHARGFGKASLDETFSLMFFGNYLVAILSGLAAEAAVDALPLTAFADDSMWYYGGCLSAFDLSAAMLFLALPLVTMLWNENYGKEQVVNDAAGEAAGDVENVPAGALAPLRRGCGYSVVCLGAVVSFFEAAMYVFVFNWTMTLEEVSTSKVPLGLVFSTFMASCMGGSSLFSVLSTKGVSLQVILAAGFIVSSLCMLVALGDTPPCWAVMAAFLVFEACVGLYWPAVGAAKARVVPEEARATIYNIYRVPLNIIVVAVLLNDIQPRMAFLGCACMLAVGALCLVGVKVPDDLELSKGKSTLLPSKDKDGPEG
jgi:MFS family permease